MYFLAFPCFQAAPSSRMFSICFLMFSICFLIFPYLSLLFYRISLWFLYVSLCFHYFSLCFVILPYVFIMFPYVVLYVSLFSLCFLMFPYFSYTFPLNLVFKQHRAPGNVPPWSTFRPLRTLRGSSSLSSGLASAAPGPDIFPRCAGRTRGAG